jgi:outer membrane biogenesis lipoprotein LolB
VKVIERKTCVALFMMALAVIVVLGGCASTTPQPNNQQSQERGHKAWCAENNGVWVVDNSVGRTENKCYSRQDYDAGLDRARRQ